MVTVRLHRSDHRRASIIKEISSKNILRIVIMYGTRQPKSNWLVGGGGGGGGALDVVPSKEGNLWGGGRNGLFKSAKREKGNYYSNPNRPKKSCTLIESPLECGDRKLKKSFESDCQGLSERTL